MSNETNAHRRDRARLAGDEPDRAMVWLTKAVDAGYHDLGVMK